MSKSLQDQLLSLGLAKDKPRRKKAGGRPAQNRHSNRGRVAPGKPQKADKAGSDGEIDLSRAYALRQQEEKRQVEQAKKKKLEDERRRRELNKQLKAIVHAHRLNDPNAEIARNFMFKGRIRKINLTAEQLKQLNQGDLGIIYLLGGYHLLVKEQVETVRQLSPEHVPDLGGSADDDEFPVPDDLVW